MGRYGMWATAGDNSDSLSLAAKSSMQSVEMGFDLQLRGLDGEDLKRIATFFPRSVNSLKQAAGNRDMHAQSHHVRLLGEPLGSTLPWELD